MNCPLHFSVVVLALTSGISFLQAQDPAPAPATSLEDIRAMRQMIEQQTLKIESLSQQVSKLNQQLEASRSAAPAPSATSTPAVIHTDARATEPASTVKPEVKPAPETRKAEPVATPGLTHVVARGENLTSIAKHYKTTVADLLKANKIEDDRKLQIGQILMIPTPKETEPTTTKKEID